MKIRVMSYNTQHCASYKNGLKIDLPLFSETIKSIGADVVVLNEMRSRGRDDDYLNQTAILAEGADYPYSYFAEAIRFSGVNPYGNSLLSRIALSEAETVMIEDPAERKYDGYYETRCILKAKLECGLTVLGVHVGLNPDEQENAITALLQHITEEKCILLGDFNMSPDDPFIGRIKEKLFDTGSLLPNGTCTFPSDAPSRKIDYIFTSPDIKIERVYVPELVVSDHRPIIADISF